MRSLSRYRCSIRRNFEISETGSLPFIQLLTYSAERAAELALAVTGCTSVVEVQRLDDPIDFVSL